MRRRSLGFSIAFVLVTLPARGPAACKLERYAELPVTMAGTKPLIAGSINGIDALFIADSGAFFSMLSYESAKKFLRHRRLLVFPFISSLALILLVASFAMPLGGMHALGALSHDGKGLMFPLYMTAYLFYLSQYFVIFFFNAALVGAVTMQLDGETPTVSDGLRIAVSKIYPILGYAFIAATVGTVLHAIRERLGFVGRFIVGLFGVGWTLATYLVVPVLAWRECGAIEAITEGADLFKRTWGETAIGGAGLGLAFAVILFGVIGCGAVLICLAKNVLHSTLLTSVMWMVVIGAVVLIALIHATLSGIYKVALFRYASGFGGTSGFDSRALEQAFQAAD